MFIVRIIPIIRNTFIHCAGKVQTFIILKEAVHNVTTEL
jgi:hypothetical protein